MFATDKANHNRSGGGDNLDLLPLMLLMQRSDRNLTPEDHHPSLEFHCGKLAPL